MPKGEDPLTKAQVELIRKWIEAGAKDDTPESEKVQFNPENPPVYENLSVLTSVDFSSDGEYLAVAGHHEALLHKADGSSLEARLIGLAERIQSVRFSPDGKYLAVTGGAPGQMGEVQIWNVERRRLRTAVPVTYDTIYGVSWSHDGKLVAFGCADNSVRAIDAKTGDQVLFNGAHNDWVLATTFSVDNSHLVSVGRDRSMKLIKVDTERFVDNITSITPGALKGGLLAVDCHPKHDELVAGGADGIPKIFRMHRVKARKIGDDYNRLQTFTVVPGRIFTVRFNGDGTRFAIGSSYNGRGEVRTYVPESKEEREAREKSVPKKENKTKRVQPEAEVEPTAPLWKLDVDGAVYSVAYSHDNQVIAACGYDGHVRLIDVESGKVLKKFVPVPLAESAKVTNKKTKRRSRTF